MTLKLPFSTCLLFFVAGLFAQQAPSCINDQIQLQKRRALSGLQYSTKNTKAIAPRYLNTVVHVLYFDENDDIFDATIELAIENLNRVFRAEGVNTSLVHPVHRDKLMDSQIQFCLAKTAPDGMATTGITHTQTDIDGFEPPMIRLDNSPFVEEIKTDSLGGVSPWDVDRYFNIWIVQIGDKALNYNYGIPRPEYFPLNALISESAIPGIVIDLDNFFTSSPLHSLEGLLAHECGHALGLMHTHHFDLNSPDPLCGGSDFMDDTPTAKSTVFCNLAMETNTCVDSLNDEPDHVSNFMNNACKLMFTPDQIATLQNNLSFAPEELFTNTSCELPTSIEKNQPENKLEFTITPNPNNGNFTIQFSRLFFPTGVLSIYNSTGQIVFKKNIHRHYGLSYHIERGELAKGVYYLTLESEQGVFSKKMVVE